MVSSISAGITEQVDDGRQLLKELEALSHALYRVKRPVEPPQIDSSSPFRKVSERTAGRGRRASEYQHRQPTISSVFRSVKQFRHSISTPNLHGAKKREQKEGFEKDLHEGSEKELHGDNEKDLDEVSNFSEWLQENATFRQKKSLWNWKPLRALVHIWQQKFHCVFLTQVHAINNLPASMNGLRLTVDFRHKDRDAQTMPCRVSQGCAEFDETLRISCTIFASKKASKGIKYMPKCFNLSVIAHDVDELELGNHQLDLTRLLPESFHEKSNVEKELNWTAGFHLSGKARGGTLTVSFGYEILDKEFAHTGGGDEGEFDTFSMGREVQDLNIPPNSPRNRRIGHPANKALSYPSFSESGVDLRHLPMEHLSIVEGEGRSHFLKIIQKARSVSQNDITFADISRLDSKIKRIPGIDALHLGNSAVQAGKSSQQQKKKVDPAPEDDVDFEVVDRGVEISTLCVNAPMRLPPTLEVEEEEFDTEEQKVDEKPYPVYFPRTDESDNRTKYMVRGEQATERGLNNSNPETQSILNENLPQKRDAEISCNHDSLERSIDTFLELGEENSRDAIHERDWKAFTAAQLKTEGEGAVSKLDDEVDLVTGEFLHMLEEGQQEGQQSSNSEPNSPRALLLKQFEEEALLEGGLGLDLCL
ncbi:hypothetical protein O6H91_21G038300 [Diphasiastrum complanatum]|uniref:Uncharacterized protein n=1 Tax=Diphasiastrum complanatum TaxID=34168 RepID=A0ACC2AJL3_DIPCM|nr:hypothetical protein O6H91_21G038300 [Diphasiastrum complanatum]